MKHFIWLLILIPVLLSVKCERDCFPSKETELKVIFSPGNIPFQRVYGLGGNGNINQRGGFYYLPISLQADSEICIFERPSRSDTLIIFYSRNFFFESERCGYEVALNGGNVVTTFTNAIVNFTEREGFFERSKYEELLFRINLWLCLLFGQVAFGQNTPRNVYIGIDVFKNLPPLVTGYFFQKSLIIEPSVWIPLGYNGVHLNITPGYSSIYANPVYKNLEYNNQGMFLKGGVNYLFFEYFSLGIAACASRYNEFGRYILEGPYYGSVEFPFNRRQVTVLGLESQTMARLPLNKRLFIAFIFRGGIHNLKRSLNPDSYYIPGMGVTSRDINITAGGSMSLQYALPFK